MCTYKGAINAAQFIFNIECPIINLNNIYQMRGNLSIFTKGRPRTDGQTSGLSKYLKNNETNNIYSKAICSHSMK